jgi:hypothetical protein
MSTVMLEPASRPIGVLGLVAVAARGATHEFHGLVDVERFRQVFERATFVGGHCVLEVRMRGNHDHRQSGPAAVDLLEQGDAAHSGHPYVRDEHVGRLVIHRFEQMLGTLEAPGVHVLLPQGFFENPADRLVVVDNPDLQCLARHAAGPV